MATESELVSVVNVIGIDCAAQPKNVGLARGTWDYRQKTISETATAASWQCVAAIIETWASGSTLLCLDAPLGWPSRLGSALHGHFAGGVIQGEANQLFRRETDDAIYAALGKRPLDIGADRIARASLAALRLLDNLRKAMVQPIPLCWESKELVETQAIEVYPAATLKARGFVHTGYKGSDSEAIAVRAMISDRLSRDLALNFTAQERGRESDHILDAMICIVAGFDFLEERCPGPSDRSKAEREGWIWVSNPNLESN